MVRRCVAWSLALGCVLASATGEAAPRIFRLEQGSLPTIKPPPPAAPGALVYYGGRVLGNVHVLGVAWGASVDATYMGKLGGFYTTITKSAWVDWMQEYDTLGLKGLVDMKTGSEQHVGRGDYGGLFTIMPKNTKTSLDDSEIQVELAAQLDAGNLPPPVTDKAGNVNSLYMVDFPAGTSITLLSLGSCSSFGAYHGTFTYKGMSVPYGVHPNCGYGFDTSTLIHSHELAEAMTDMEVGLIETNMTVMSQRPLAWVTEAPTAWASNEAGDLCEGTSDTIDGYVVQKIWSNYANGCVSNIPICDGVMMPPACRPCTPFDDGNACGGAKPACATTGPKQGQCVECTAAYAEACRETLKAVCDDPSYTCVGCLSNKDCGGASPVCESTSKTCRPCNSDADCSASADGKYCDTSSDGYRGHCVACMTDAECPAGDTCSPSNHTCVAPLPPPDAGAPVDAGPEAGVADTSGGGSGCGCDSAGSGQSNAPSGLAAVAVALVLARRRRR